MLNDLIVLLVSHLFFFHVGQHFGYILGNHSDRQHEELSDGWLEKPSVKTDLVPGTENQNVYQSPRAAIINHNKVGNYYKQKFILSKFWRLEVQNEGVRKAKIPQKVFLVSSSSWQVLTFIGLWQYTFSLYLCLHMTFISVS